MNRAFLLAFLAFAAPGIGRAQSGEYEVVQVDAKAETFTGRINGQLKTFRVRPSVETSINGVKATFAELEPGMKVKVTSAEPGLATRLAASGLRTAAPAVAPRAGAAPAPQASRQVKASIAANAPDGFPIGDVRKGTRISLQYVGGLWKDHGSIADLNPDTADPKFWESVRLAIALPAADGQPGEVQAIVPGGTAKRPFVFEADRDFPGLVLRIKAGHSSNPGKVDYNVKILPPAR